MGAECLVAFGLFAVIGVVFLALVHSSNTDTLNKVKERHNKRFK